jgi:hypothetical protein
MLPSIALAYTNPSGYWALDEPNSANSAVDASGNHQHGIPTGCPPVVTGVQTGVASPKARSFNGFGTQFITIPMTTAVKPAAQIAVSVWFKGTSTDVSGSDLVSAGDSYAIRILNTGAATFFIYRGLVGGTPTWLSCVTPAAGLLDGQWHRIVGEKTDAQLAVYLNDSGTPSCTLATTVPIDYTLGTNLIIGKHGDGSGSYDVNGTIDEVCVYPAAFANAEQRAAGCHRVTPGDGQIFQ